MPATVFPASGYSFRVTATDDVTSNAAAWYLNDLNTLTTSPNTATNKTFYYENNNVAAVGTFTSVRIYTTSTVEITYDAATYSIVSNDESTSNFIPYYINELNVLTSRRNTTNIRTFFINNYNNTNLGNFVRVRISGTLYSEEIDVIQRTNNSFTIAIPPNWPAISVGLSVNIGRYAYTPITAYSEVIAVNSNTNRTFSLTKPIGFPEVGSTIYAILPAGVFGVADPVGIVSTLTNAVAEKRLTRIIEPPRLPIVVANTKGIKVDLKNDRAPNSFGITRSLTKIGEPFAVQSRQRSLTTSTDILYLSYPLKILGSNLVRNIDLSWYIRDNDIVSLTRSTSSFVTYNFINPNDPFNLGVYTKAKLYNPVWEKVVDVFTNTNNSITVLRSEEIPEVSQLNVFLGNTATFTTASLSNSNTIPLINYIKSPAVDPRSNIASSLINRSGIKVVGDPIRLRTEKIILQNLIREPIVLQSRTVTYTNFTSTIFTDLIRVTGRSGITTDLTNYYIYENNTLLVQRSSSSFVTLFFNNPNNNQNIGSITAVRLISPRFDITLSVQSFTSDSVTVADVLGFNNFQTAQTVNDLSIRLGINFSDRSVTYSNSNVTPLVEKLKTSAITTPNSLIVPKLIISSPVRDTGIRIRHTDFRVMTKVVGESRALRTEQTSTAVLQKTQLQVKEPIVLPSRTVTTSSFTNTIYTEPIRITGSSGVTSNFATSYVFENVSFTLTRSTASSVILYFNNPNNNVNIGNIVTARLVSPRFDIIVNVQSYTTDSITVVDIFSFNNIQSSNSINDLTVRLGLNFADRSVSINNANRVALINPFKTSVAFNSRVDTLGNTKIRDRNFSTIEIPRVSFYRNISSLRDTITYQPQNIVTPATTTLLFSNLIDIGGTTKTTSTFVSYYVNENNTVTTYTVSTTTTTLLFANTTPWAPTPSVVRLFAYRTVDGNENAVYDVTLPIVSVNSQSVTVNWQTFEYKIRVQLGSVITVSGGTRANYYTGGLAIANLNAQRFKADRNHVFTIGQGGVLRTANQKLSAITVPLAVSKFNQSIVIRGEGRTIPQRTTTVTTASTLILEPFPVYVWGKTETTSTAVKWYYNEENILQTTNSTSSLVTLYFDGLPIYQRTSAPFIKLFAPNAGYDYVYPVVTATVDSVTVQNIGIFPSVSGMYFYWARQRQIESISYNDVGQIPQLRAQKFGQFQDPTTNKVYSSFTSTEQGFIVYDRHVTGIAYVGSSTELTLNAPIIAPAQGQFAKIQYVDNNYYRTVPNTRRAVRFNGVDTFIRFSASTVIGAQPSRTTPVMAEAWINLDSAEGCIIMSEEYTGGADPINLTLAVGNAPGVSGTRVWFGFYDGVAWAYATTNRSLDAGKWYHVAGQFDGTQIRMYIDGVQDGTAVAPVAGWNTTASAGSLFYIGRRWDTFAGDGQRPFFKGLIYQARVVLGQLVYTKNFVPPLNTALTENSGATKFLACAFPIDQPVAQNWVGFQTPLSYQINGALTFEIASIPPRYTFDAYPEEIYEINSATTTKIYLKGRIAYRPITNTEYLQDDTADRPINTFDVYFLGVTQNYSVVRSTFTITTSTLVLGNLRQSVPRVAFGIEIPRVGKTLSIPKLRETLPFSSKSVISVNSVTQMTFSTTPLPVYGITQSTSTFISYYVNESNTLITIPTGTALVTLYLGLNPEYYRPLGTTVRIVNNNNGYDVQYNIVASTVDSITIANARDLPSVSGMVVYYGSVQTSYPSVNFSDSNAVGRINKNTVGQTWFETRRETAGQIRQSLIVKGDRSDNQLYSNTNFVSQLRKGAITLRNVIEIPREFKFSTAPKIADPGRYQNPTYTITTGSETIFYNAIGLGRIASTTTFVTYYVYENNTIQSIYSTGTQKVFNFSEGVNPSLGFTSVRIQGYRFETVGENVIFDITLPIAAITTNTIAVNFPEPFPDLLYRASLGKTFTTFSQRFSGTNAVTLINPFKTPVVENNQRPPALGQINKRLTVVRDLQPTNNFQIGNYGQTKIRLAGDRTFISTTTVSTTSAQLIYLEPVAISGNNRSTSTFVSYYISEEQAFTTFNSTSVNITLYFDRTVQVTADYTVARFTNFINYEFTTTIVSVNSQSVTIVNPQLLTQTLPNGGLTVYLGKVWPGQVFRRVTNDSALQIPGINLLKIPSLPTSNRFGGIEIPTTVAKLNVNTPLRYISNINRFTVTPVRVINSLRAERNADPHRTRTVTTTTSLTFETTAFRVYGTNLSTSTAVRYYLDDGDILRTIATTSTSLQLLLGELPIYLQLQGRTTHIRVINSTGFDQQFTITNFTRDSVSIQQPIYFPSISDITIYFGAVRSFDTLTWNDTNSVAKLNYKWTNWHTHLVQPVALLNKSLIVLKDIANKTTTTSIWTNTSVIQKPVTAIKGVIEVPRTDKVTRPIIVKDVTQYTSRSVTRSTSSAIIFLGPFDATGKIGSTSSFLSSYIFDSDIIFDYTFTGTTATLYFSNYIAPANENYSLIRVQGFDSGFDLPIFDQIYAVNTYTNNTVSFNFTGTLPGSRYRVFLGRSVTSSTATLSDAGNVALINRVKNYQGFSFVDTPISSVLEKRSIVVKDFVNNIRVGQARALTKIAGDRSYSVTTSTISYSTSTIYLDPVVVSGINRSQTNFTQTYINDGDLITVTNNTSTIVTLNLAQNIPYTGLANVVRIARYGAGFYVGNRFFITNTEFEVTYPIISYTTSSVTINIGNNLSYFDPNIRSLAAYIGQNYQQPNSISVTNTSTLAVTHVTAFKPVIGITSFALSPITAKLSVANKVKGIDVPIRIDTFKPKSSATLKGFFATTTTAAPGKVISIPTVKDGYYPNLNTRTRTVTTNTTVVYEADVYRIYGTSLTTSSFISSYVFETDLITTSTTAASTITLFMGSLPVIDPGLGLYVRITNFTSFNTVTQVLSRTAGSIVINTPVGLPSISSLFLYFGALRNVETVSYADNNFNELNLFTDVASGVAFRKELITYPTFTPISVASTGTGTFFSLNYMSFLQGQQAFTTPGTYTWIAPPGVTTVSVVVVGGGGRGGFGGQSATYRASGGGGGGLGYRNNITVIPGQAYTVVVGAGGSTSIAVAADTSSLGANGGDSFFINSSLVLGRGGTGGGSQTVSPVGGGFIGDGGGTGGTGGSAGQNAQAGGGGGAGGYTGNGGDAGGFAFSSPGAATATAGSGGGGGGGDKGTGRANESPGYAGGGVGLLGLGSNGAAGSSGVGGGGSGGTNGVIATDIGGAYGGGGPANNGAGGSGAVRIIWGTNRAFPSTSTNDLNLINTLPKPGDYVKISDLVGNAVLTRIYDSGLTGITVPTTDLTTLTGSSSTWSLILWDPSVYPQTQVRTTVAPTKPRELFYYSNISAIRYGRKLTVYPNEAVSPVNNIPPKTRTASTNVNTIVYDPEPFFIYGTNNTPQTNLSWYTTETNFIVFDSAPYLLELKLGARGATYGLNFFNQYAYVRLVNNTGYDQWFGIIARSSDSISIFNPYNLPSISSLSMYFGRIRQTDFLFWNDQGIVPTFTSTLALYTATINPPRIILSEVGLITVPYNFRSVNRVIESTIYSTATNLVGRTASPMALFTDTRAGIGYNKLTTGYYSAPIALSSTTSVTSTTTILQFLNQAIGQQAYTTAGTYSWTAPANVFYVSAVAVGGGGAGGVGRAFGDRQRGGGGGGGLGWKNMIPVVPGQSYTVQVGAAGTGTSSATGAGPFGNGNPGEASFFINTATVAGFGGTGATNVNFAGVAGVGGGYIGDGGGFGGNGGVDVTTISEGRGGGGGGAGGYIGNGGRGGDGTNSAIPATQPTNGAGGGGAGGSSVYGTFNDNGNAQASSGAGGGVGLFGYTANGIATPNQIWVGNPGSSVVLGGGGGSGGAQGGSGQTAFATGLPMPGAAGGAYGAGGGGTGAGGTGSPIYTGGNGGGGAVRLIWGTGRGFPSMFTADQSSIDLTSQIRVGDAVRIVDSAGTIGTAEITAITTTTMSVKTADLARFTGNPSTWTVTLWDRTLYPQSSVLITSARSTGLPRENLALEQLAPGLRYNRTITQGITFAPYPNNIQVGPVKSATTLKSPTNISANTVTNYMFRLESENTQTIFTNSIRESSKSILYYTTLAQGIRSGISLPLKILAFRETLPTIPYFANFNVSGGKSLISVPNPSAGNLGKQVISIRHIPTQFDRVGGFRIIPSMRGDTLRATVSFVDRPKLAPTGWNTVEVVSRGVIDKRFTVIKSGDLRNFTADKLSSSLKVIPDSNRFYGDQRIRIIQYLQTPASRVRADVVERAKIPSANTQVFETPRASQVNRQFATVKSIDSNIHIVNKLNVTAKVLGFPFYTPVTNVNKANLLDLRQVVFSEQRGKLDVAIKVKDLTFNTTVPLLQKPVTKLAFKDDSSLLYTQKLGNLQKGQFKVFFLDQNLGWMNQPVEFINLATVQFEDEFGKILPYTKISSANEIEKKPFGQFETIEKIGLQLINFNTTGKVKISSKGIAEPVDIQLTVSVRGLITRFTAARSGNLHDPSTRRAVPIQFWN